MKKNDLILIAVILIIGIGSFAGVKLYGSLSTKSEPEIVIKVDGKEYKRVSLKNEETIKVEIYNGNYNVIKIHDNRAEVIEATCPDKLCVHQKAIEYQGESLVCLPNKVIVEVNNGDKSSVDSVAN